MRRDLTRWLVGHTRALVPVLALSALARVANQLLGVTLFVVAVTAVTRAATGTPVSVGALIGWLVVVALVKAGLRYTEHFAGHWVAFTALERLRELFFAALVPQAPAATTGRAGAELTQRATRDIDRVEVFFAHTFPPVVSAVVVPAVALTWLGLAVDGTLAVLLALVVLAMLLVPLAAGRATWAAARGVAAARGRIAAHVDDDVQGIREVLAFDLAERRLGGLGALDDELGAARAVGARVAAARAGTNALLQAATLLVPLLVGAHAGLSAAGTAAALAVAVGLWVPARGVEGFTAGLDAAFAAAQRLREVVDAPPVVVDPASPGPLPSGSGIALDAVTVHYPGASRPALTDVTARLDTGAWTVVCGVSGSGKSTLAALLTRDLDPVGGAVSLGGADLRGLGVDEVRRRVAVVEERPTVMSGNLADAVRLAAPQADDDTVADALRIAALDEWVAGLPDGLATPVRERGHSVSGGQLQRLALARALVANPAVLVLDEALSQLDADTARTVRSRLTAHRPGLTVVEVTHRADLVGDDTPVLVLDGGRLVEQGTAGALRATGGMFVRLEARG